MVMLDPYLKSWLRFSSVTGDSRGSKAASSYEMRWPMVTINGVPAPGLLCVDHFPASQLSSEKPRFRQLRGLC